MRYVVAWDDRLTRKVRDDDTGSAYFKWPIENMIRIFLTLISIMILHPCLSQDAENRAIDSLEDQLGASDNDTMRLILLGQIADKYSEINYDSSFYYAEKTLPITRNLRLKLEEAVALRLMTYAQINLGNFPRALQYLLPAIEIVSDPSSEKKLIPASYPPMDEFMDRSMSARSQRLTQERRHRRTASNVQHHRTFSF